MEDYKNAVYKIECKNCKLMHIGQTGMNISKIMHHHNNNLRKHAKPSTALSAYLKTNKHLPELVDIKILNIEKHKFKRNLFEGI